MIATMAFKKNKKKRKQQPETVVAVEDWEKELLETKEKLAETEERAKAAEEWARVAEERAKKAEEMVESLKKAPQTKTSIDEEELSDDDDLDARDPWMIAFQEFREYRSKNGNCNATRNGSNPKVGRWIKNQKFFYGKGKLSKGRVTLLESVDGFHWGKGHPEPKSWESMLEELQKYQKAMGHCNVPMNPTSPTALAKWVSAQRVEYKHFKKGRMSCLTSEQIAQLREMGFQWNGPKLI
jgi:hypothetical protein